MLFRKAAVLLFLLISTAAFSAEDVTDKFALLQNSGMDVYLKLDSDSAGVSAGQRVNWIGDGDRLNKFDLLSKFDNYIISMAPPELRVVSGEAPDGFVAVDNYRIYIGELDDQPGEDFLIWIAGTGGLILSPYSSTPLTPLDISGIQDQIDINDPDFFLTFQDMSGDGVEDILLVSEGEAYQFDRHSSGYSPAYKAAVKTLVGEIPGSYSVTNSGAFTYSLPLNLPSGPGLAITYNSRAGMGGVGYRWMLSGLSIVHRCGSDFYRDGIRKPITLTAADNTCVNGVRVVDERLEIDDFSKIENTENGYRITSRNGIVRYYEYAVSLGGVPYQWHLSRLEDNHDNQLLYQYYTEGGKAYLDSVVSDDGKIEFSYQESGPYYAKYVAGHPTFVSKKLSEVKIYSDAGGKRKISEDIVFQYKRKEVGGSDLNFLDKILFCKYTELGIRQCLPDTGFEWNDGNLSFVESSLQKPTATNTIDSRAVDWNGDGVKDLLVQNRNGLYIYINDGENFSDPEMVRSLGTSKDIFSMVAGDFYNLGYDQILFKEVSYVYDIFSQKQAWKILSRDGVKTVFDLGVKTWSAETEAGDIIRRSLGMSRINSPTPVVSDVNSDGFQDLLFYDDEWILKLNKGSEGYDFHSGNSLGIDVQCVSSILPAGYDSSGVKFFYANNSVYKDCSDDTESRNYSVLVFDNQGNIISSHDTGISIKDSYVMDYNKDGIADILTLDDDGKLVVSINRNGFSFEELETGVDGKQALEGNGFGLFPSFSGVKTLDVDNDGHLDIIYPQGDSYRCLLSRPGIGFKDNEISIKNSGALLEGIEPVEGCLPVYNKIIEITNRISELAARRNGEFLYDVANFSGKNRSAIGTLERQKATAQQLKNLLASGADGGLKGLVQSGGCYSCSIENIDKSLYMLNKYISTVNTLAAQMKQAVKFYDDGHMTSYNAFLGLYIPGTRLLESSIWSGAPDYEISLTQGFSFMVCKDAEEAPYNMWGVSIPTIHTGDFTADGIDDVISLGGLNNTTWQVHENQSSSGLMEVVRSGKKEIKVSYKTQAQMPSYVPGGKLDRVSIPFNNLIHMVDEVVTRYSGIKIHDYKYSYSDLRYHVQGLGFQGGAVKATTNVLKKTKTVDRFESGFPLTGLLSSRSEYVGENHDKLIARLDNEWQYLETGGGDSGLSRYLRQKKAKYSNRYNIQGNYVSGLSVLYTYDEYSNIKNTVEKYWRSTEANAQSAQREDYELKKTYSYNYDVDLNNWILNNRSGITESHVLLSHSGANLSSRDLGVRTITSNLEYYPGTTSLKSKTIDYGSGLNHSSWYRYNDRGITIEESSSDADRVHTRSLSYGIYPKEVYSQGYNASQYFDYDPVIGKPIKITDYNGNISKFSYDALGREVRSETASGNVTTTKYISCNESAACDMAPEASYKVAVDSGGAPAEEVYYDALGRKVLQRTELQFSSGWKSVVTEYNQAGYLFRESLPFISENPVHWITYSNYDDLGRVGLISYPDGSQLETLYEFTDEGLEKVTKTELVKLADGTEKTRVSEYYYNALNQLVNKKEAVDSEDEISVAFGYDPLGNQDWVQVNNDENLTTVSTYNNAGFKTRIMDPSTGLTTYRYDAKGRVVNKTDAKGQETEFSYDAIGRLKYKVEKEAGLRKQDLYSRWYYDRDSNCRKNLPFNTYIGSPCKIVSNKYSKDIRYDSFGNPVFYTEAINGNKFSGYARFDAAGRLTSETLASGLGLQYSYQKGYLSRVLTNNKTLWQAKSNDEFGNVDQYRIGNAIDIDKKYSSLTGRINQLSANRGSLQIQKNQYGWNSDGTLAYREWQYPVKNREDFKYDNQKRLSNLTSDLATRFNRDYEYSASGNIESKSDIAGSYIYGENGAGPYSVTSAGQARYFYDENGNLTVKDPDGVGSHPGFSIQYNYSNKPTFIEDNSGYTEFEYAPDLGRYLKIRTTAEGSKAYTYYLDSGRVEIRKSGSTTEKVSYVGDYAQLREYGTDELFDANQQQKQWNYLLRDHLGSVEVITDEAGKVAAVDGRQQYFTYDPFGNPRVELGELSNRGFTDHEHLKESGLIHMNGRVYDAQIARFLSADVVVQAPEFSQSYNRYSYVWNSPMSMTDPSGYLAQEGLQNIGENLKRLGIGDYQPVSYGELTPFDNYWANEGYSLVSGIVNGGIFAINTGLVGIEGALRGWGEITNLGIEGSARLFDTQPYRVIGNLNALAGAGRGLSFARNLRGFSFVNSSKTSVLSSGIGTHFTVERLLNARISLGLNGSRKVRNRNFAIADFNINGEQGIMFALSGRKSPVGTVGIPENRRFITGVVNGTSRAYDTEVKILENLANMYSSNARGVVTISSELRVCNSCAGVIRQFQESHPGISVITATGPYATKPRFQR